MHLWKKSGKIFKKARKVGIVMRGVRLQLVLVTAAALLLLLFSSLAFPNGRLGQTIEIDTNYIHGHQNT